MASSSNSMIPFLSSEAGIPNLLSHASSSSSSLLFLACSRRRPGKENRHNPSPSRRLCLRHSFLVAKVASPRGVATAGAAAASVVVGGVGLSRFPSPGSRKRPQPPYPSPPLRFPPSVASSVSAELPFQDGAAVSSFVEGFCMRSMEDASSSSSSSSFPSPSLSSSSPLPSSSSSALASSCCCEDEGEREVQCEVKTISWRERQISASILVNTSVERVWDVLTDYERLAEFIPNLVCSKQIPCPHLGRIWLLQIGVQRTMYWNIEARVVLDLEELLNSAHGRELRFIMIDGDFKRYDGKWSLRAGPRKNSTMLYYEVNVVPRLFFPAAFVERIIRSDMPANLRALAERAEADHSLEQKASASSGSSTLTKLEKLTTGSVVDRESTSTEDTIVNSAPGQKAAELKLLRDAQVTEFKGISVKKVNEVVSISNKEGYELPIHKSCRLEQRCRADEIHFRRVDDLLENGGVHRQVIATITVKAPPQQVWTVLTDYESLPGFVPNLASSKVLYRNGENVRLLQEGCKCLLYMVLHARVVLDLWERPGYKIIFKQFEGDFDSFQGRWDLKQFGSQHTLLKYVVDTKIRKECLLSEAIVEEVVYEDLPMNLCAIRDRVEALETKPFEPVASTSYTNSLEEALIYRDVSGNVRLTEDKDLDGSMLTTGISLQSESKKVRVADLCQDFSMLEKELRGFIEKHGLEGIMPMRRCLRKHGRIDLEKAITKLGGFRYIAVRMNLRLAYKERKPKGYWDRWQNLKDEVIMFQKECKLDMNLMPSRKQLKEAGRSDLARAFEKWGGLQEVAKVLGLQPRRLRKRSTQQSLWNNQSKEEPLFEYGLHEIEEQIERVRMLPNVSKLYVSSSGGGREDKKLPFKTSLPQRSSKWMEVLGKEKKGS